MFIIKRPYGGVLLRSRMFLKYPGILPVDKAYKQSHGFLVGLLDAKR
jgi:hypothetical protein